jgi:hypothetical protein
MAEISRLSVELHKATGDFIWSSFSKAHDEALALYDGRKLNECIHKCLEILNAQSEALLYRQVANHFRISTLMLLCVVVRDNVSFFAGRPDLYLVTHGIGMDNPLRALVVILLTFFGRSSSPQEVLLRPRRQGDDRSYREARQVAG